MSWDEQKIDGVSSLTANEWNDHVSDQKSRAKVVTGTSAPVSAPPMIGAIYVDTNVDSVYIATGDSSVDDWTSLITSSEAVFETAVCFKSEISSSSTIDWSLGNKQSIVLTGNVTLTFTDPTGPCNLILKIVQDAIGGWSPTFPSNVKFDNTTVLDFSSDPGNSARIVSLYFDGTDYYAQITDYFV